MNDKYILTVIGDSNDADYETMQREIRLTDWFIKEGEFVNINRISIESFLLVLSNVLYDLKANGAHHNWNRDEFDDGTAEKELTTCKVASKLLGYEIDPSRVDFDILENYSDEDDLAASYHPDEPEYDWKLSEFIFGLAERIQEYLPYGEFGIHTIKEISITPFTSKTVYYKNSAL